MSFYVRLGQVSSGNDRLCHSRQVYVWFRLCQVKPCYASSDQVMTG